MIQYIPPKIRKVLKKAAYKLGYKKRLEIRPDVRLNESASSQILLQMEIRRWVQEGKTHGIPGFFADR
jgi:hypothetical protein